MNKIILIFLLYDSGKVGWLNRFQHFLDFTSFNGLLLFPWSISIFVFVHGFLCRYTEQIKFSQPAYLLMYLQGCHQPRKPGRVRELKICLKNPRNARKLRAEGPNLLTMLPVTLAVKKIYQENCCTRELSGNLKACNCQTCQCGFILG